MKIKSSTLSAFFNPRVLAGFVICLAGLTLGFFAFVAKAVPPVVITVNTLLDETTSGDGLCSLREAITNANDNAQTYPECAAGSGANGIAFSVSGTITLGSTLPAINDDLTIDGGGQSITVSGNNSVQVMAVNSGKTLTLHNLTISNGHSGGVGGGIANVGTLNVTNSIFSGNSASDGGGILNVGHPLKGGGGMLNVTNSTFSGNSASVRGGGIHNESDLAFNGTLNVTNSTFSGNSASISGAGIFNFANINEPDATTTLKNTIIANSTSGGNCFNGGRGTLTADSHNLADDNTCGSATQATSAQINLQPLANNGGPTQTIALGAGSVAIDAGDETACAAPPVNEFDQRGVTRPFDGDGDHIAICDTGAYELRILLHSESNAYTNPKATSSSATLRSKSHPAGPPH